ncbi:MAG: biotin carboxylase N-terminal domain-containing protein [Marmoricola sp.]
MTGSTINRLLVANRGEIARRVFATCRLLGIETVAVHSDADADLPFVREADFAVRLPGFTPAETYLRLDLVIDAARSAGADAIHPGYGFLSENAAFARAVLEAGLNWVGPDPESIDAMGSKIEAKKLMADAGVPILTELSPSAVTGDDLPVLVKASAGGGGRGMRIVRVLDTLDDDVAKAEAEAASAFGDGTVFIEPYLEHGRHVEVQVVGDSHGGVLVLGERDCSLQRRHQKVVEEAPAPGLSDELRATLHEAARKAATATGYVGAGTVEFMVSGDRAFFLEMNTRLQVEHPVTEAVFGIDLVAAQIAIAEGASVDTLRVRQPEGHAIEVRLYAEDPAADYQPQSGRLESFEIPGVDVEFGELRGPGLRLDSGFESGNEVGTHYDAMLAKLICWAPTRAQAARRLAGALSRSRLHGLTTNRDLLVASLRHDAFLAGDVSTDFFDLHPEAGREPDLAPAAFAAAVMLAEQDRLSRRVQQTTPVAWRNVVSQPQRTVFAHEKELVVEWFGGRDGYRHATRVDLIVVSASATAVVLEVAGVRSHFDGVKSTAGVGSPRELFVDGPLASVRLRETPRFVDPADVVAQGSLLAPMPGTVIDALEAGVEVMAGQSVLVLEAMKMQHTISAPIDGVLTEIAVAVGHQVAAGEVLAVVTPDSAEPDQGDTA